MKSIQRTHRLDHGRDIGGGVSVKYEETAGGPRKIRCPKCGSQYAVPSKTASGKEVFKCGCGAMITSTRMT